METLKVKITDRNGKIASGEVRLQFWDKKTATKRALKVLGACWAGSIFAIMLPIIHFVLVPGLFLGGIVAALIISNQKSVVLGGVGTCPTCNEPFMIVRNADVWPLSDMCDKCQSIVTIEKTDKLHVVEQLPNSG